MDGNGLRRCVSDHRHRNSIEEQLTVHRNSPAPCVTSQTNRTGQPSSRLASCFLMGCGNNGLLLMGNRLTLATVGEIAIRWAI